jgi:hypothetical protein
MALIMDYAAFNSKIRLFPYVVLFQMAATVWSQIYLFIFPPHAHAHRETEGPVRS